MLQSDCSLRLSRSSMLQSDCSLRLSRISLLSGFQKQGDQLFAGKT